MSNRNPPHRPGPNRGPQRSTIPAKRPADTQEEEWVRGESKFALQQEKKKARIRVKAGRAKPIDWLAVTLGSVDEAKNIFDDDDEDDDMDIVDPEGVFETLDKNELLDLEREIESFIALETNRKNREYWNTMKTICKDRLQELNPSAPKARGVSSVSADIDRILNGKSLEQLEKLESQIRPKLSSNQPDNTEYWEHLLQSLLARKARAKLREIAQSLVSGKLQTLRKQQKEEAKSVGDKLQKILGGSSISTQDGKAVLKYSPSLDPEPLLKLRPEDKALDTLSEKAFLEKIAEERCKALKLGYVPMRKGNMEKPSNALTRPSGSGSGASKADDFSKATAELLQREIAKGVQENEEIFTGEEEVDTLNKTQWAGKHRPRKPISFNRVQMGYEWNKYNQTHYDHDNPPPKVVQGYKFNIFYPDLIDKTKAPTYRIERENERKRGQSFAPAGEDDTCLIRFIAGPPYEDIAFRIVDKEWDYSAKRERGFKSSFDKGILQLHFQFKKIYYRK